MRIGRAARVCLGALCLASCQNEPAQNELAKRLQRMVDQDRCAADDTSTYFRNGACNQIPPAGVRAFGAAADDALSTGRDASGQPVRGLPMRVDRALVERGHARFDLFCATCHGLLGNGESEVAENMSLRRPPALFASVVRALPDGQIFRVITEGYGLMPSYAHSLNVEQRWAVVAYVRALALSQSVPLAALPPAAQEEARRWLH